MYNNEDEDIMVIREKNIQLLKEEFQKIFGSELPQPIQEKPRQKSKRVSGIKSGENEGPRRSTRLMKKECLSIHHEIEGDMGDLHIIRRKTVDNIKRKEVRVQLLPEQVTEDILQKIYYRSTGKVYDSINGTTCHQCRQKTIDVKSICRNEKCFGLRGQFCGFCLSKRYGEDVAVVLKDPVGILCLL
uniref:Zf-4CXXC_R1 domain-containing protein n=1 Tax=Rhodnius prolixus TaxID=13249 RepID=T1IAU9_RHOPR